MANIFRLASRCDEPATDGEGEGEMVDTPAEQESAEIASSSVPNSAIPKRHFIQRSFCWWDNMWRGIFAYLGDWMFILFKLWAGMLAISFLLSSFVALYADMGDKQLDNLLLNGWLQEIVDIFSIVPVGFLLFMVVNFPGNYNSREWPTNFANAQRIIILFSAAHMATFKCA